VRVVKNIGGVDNTNSCNEKKRKRKEKEKKKTLLKRCMKYRFTLKQTTEKLKPGD